LYDSGAQLIGGLFKGMTDIWKTVEAWLGARTKELQDFIGLTKTAENASGDQSMGTPASDPAYDSQKGRALGGPLNSRYTLVGEYGPELLINKQLVMPHGASMSRIAAMGGMANGGTTWGSWLAGQPRSTREMVRAMRAAGTLNAANRREMMGYQIAEDGTRVPNSFYRDRDARLLAKRDRAAAYGDRTGDYARRDRIAEREEAHGIFRNIYDPRRAAQLQNERNSDALNRANDYGDRTGDYARRDRVLAREARRGTLTDNGLSRQEREYIIQNYGSINVYTEDGNVGRAIAEHQSTRRR
jgi:hypothetical protein